MNTIHHNSSSSAQRKMRRSPHEGDIVTLATTHIHGEGPWVIDSVDGMRLGTFRNINTGKTVAISLSHIEDIYYCDDHHSHLLFHDRYKMWFCPWCGIDRDEKIKNHPLSQKLLDVWSPYEGGSAIGWENVDYIILVITSLPIVGIFTSFLHLRASFIFNDEIGNMARQMGIVALLSQLIWVIIAATLFL